MPYRDYDIAEWPLKAKRIALKSYSRGTEGHQCFRLKDGTVYEGYIWQVDRETLAFEWAFGVWSDPDILQDDPHLIVVQIDDVAALVV